MIIKLEKKFNECNIAICGRRSDILSKVLDDFLIKHDVYIDENKIISNYDFIFGSGVYSIIKEKSLKLSKYGWFGIHETPLPEGRGNAPIYWTIANNRKNIVATLFKFSKELDNGEICYQYNVGIDKIDCYKVLEKKRQLAVESC